MHVLCEFYHIRVSGKFLEIDWRATCSCQAMHAILECYEFLRGKDWW